MTQYTDTIRRRKHASFRVDPYLWGLFRDRCKNLGLSTCFTLEGLMRAWVTGSPVNLPQPRPMTVNMRVDYVVDRPRRGPPSRLAPFGERRCWGCGSPKVREFEDPVTRLVEGECLKCGTKWLIHPRASEAKPEGVSHL